MSGSSFAMTMVVCFGQNGWGLTCGNFRKAASILMKILKPRCTVNCGRKLGWNEKHVQVLGRTRYWLKYQLPDRYIRKNSVPLCIGQKQIWFMLRLVSHESNVRFDHCPKPEFDGWRWVDYWEPLRDVVYFQAQGLSTGDDGTGRNLDHGERPC